MTDTKGRSRAENLLDDVFSALALFSRLPLPVHAPRGAETAWAWPLAGALIGAICALAGGLAMALGLPPSASALFVLTCGVMITGALHEDGLADTADGLWGGWDRARRLEIMKDSRIGSYGVVALILAFAARWTAISALLAHGGHHGAVGIGAALIAAGALSRGGLPGVMHLVAPARADGLSVHTGRPDRMGAVWAAGIACGLAFALLGWAAFAALLLTLLALLGLAVLAKARIGGQTGDILGAMQVVVEIAVLFACI